MLLPSAQPNLQSSSHPNTQLSTSVTTTQPLQETTHSNGLPSNPLNTTTKEQFHRSTQRTSCTAALHREHSISASNWKSQENRLQQQKEAYYDALESFEKTKETFNSTNTPLHAARSTNHSENPIDSEEDIFYDALDKLPENKHTASDKQTTHNSTITEDEDIFYDALTIQEQLEHSAQKINWTEIQSRIKTALGDQLAALANPHALLSLTLSNAIAGATASFLGINFLPALFMQTGFYTASTVLNTLIHTLRSFNDPSLNQFINTLQLTQHGLSGFQAGLLLNRMSSVMGFIHTSSSYLISFISSSFITPLVHQATPTLARCATTFFKCLNHSNPKGIGQQLAHTISFATSSGLVQAAGLLLLVNHISPAGGSPVNSYSTLLPTTLPALNATGTPAPTTASAFFSTPASTNTTLSASPTSTANFSSLGQVLESASTILSSGYPAPTSTFNATVEPTPFSQNATPPTPTPTPTPPPARQIHTPTKVLQMPFTGITRDINPELEEGFDRGVQLPNTTARETQNIPENICDLLHPEQPAGTLMPINISAMTTEEIANIPVTHITADNISAAFNRARRTYFITTLTQFENAELLRNLSIRAAGREFFNTQPLNILISKNITDRTELAFNGASAFTEVEDRALELIHHNLFTLTNTRDANRVGYVILPCMDKEVPIEELVSTSVLLQPSSTIALEPTPSTSTSPLPCSPTPEPTLLPTQDNRSLPLGCDPGLYTREFIVTPYFNSLTRNELVQLNDTQICQIAGAPRHRQYIIPNLENLTSSQRLEVEQLVMNLGSECVDAGIRSKNPAAVNLRTGDRLFDTSDTGSIRPFAFCHNPNAYFDFLLRCNGLPTNTTGDSFFLVTSERSRLNILCQSTSGNPCELPPLESSTQISATPSNAFSPSTFSSQITIATSAVEQEITPSPIQPTTSFVAVTLSAEGASTTQIHHITASPTSGDVYTATEAVYTASAENTPFSSDEITQLITATRGNAEITSTNFQTASSSVVVLFPSNTEEATVAGDIPDEDWIVPVAASAGAAMVVVGALTICSIKKKEAILSLFRSAKKQADSKETDNISLNSLEKGLTDQISMPKAFNKTMNATYPANRSAWLMGMRPHTSPSETSEHNSDDSFTQTALKSVGGNDINDSTELVEQEFTDTFHFDAVSLDSTKKYKANETTFDSAIVIDNLNTSEESANSNDTSGYEDGNQATVIQNISAVEQDLTDNNEADNMSSSYTSLNSSLQKTSLTSSNASLTSTTESKAVESEGATQETEELNTLEATNVTDDEAKDTITELPTSPIVIPEAFQHTKTETSQPKLQRTPSDIWRKKLASRPKENTDTTLLPNSRFGGYVAVTAKDGGKLTRAKFGALQVSGRTLQMGDKGTLINDSTTEAFEAKLANKIAEIKDLEKQEANASSATQKNQLQARKRGAIRQRDELQERLDNIKASQQSLNPSIEQKETVDSKTNQIERSLYNENKVSKASKLFESNGLENNASEQLSDDDEIPTTEI